MKKGRKKMKKGRKVHLVPAIRGTEWKEQNKNTAQWQRNAPYCFCWAHDIPDPGPRPSAGAILVPAVALLDRIQEFFDFASQRSSSLVDLRVGAQKKVGCKQLRRSSESSKPRSKA
jgi:hypothetical protein